MIVDKLTVPTLNPITLKRESGVLFDAADMFATGYFEPAVMPMRLVRPATDEAVAGIYSVDHRGLVGRESQVRITIQGGAFPYTVVPASMPVGATVGKTVFDDDYMVIKFTPTQNGVYKFDLTVFDNEGRRCNVRFSQTVDASWCKFVSPSGSNSNDGSENSPWRDITHACSHMTGGRTLILKDGTYTDILNPITLSNQTCNSVIAYNQKGAIVDTSTYTNTNMYAVVFKLESSHVLLQGIVFRNPPITGGNARYVFCSNSSSYLYEDNLEFYINGRMGTANTDNISCFFCGYSLRSFIAQTRCVFDGLAGTANGEGNGWNVIDLYDSRHAVVEDNIFQNQFSPTDGCIWIKAGEDMYVDVRRNRFLDDWQGSAIHIYLGALADDTTGYIDVSYNYLDGCNLTLVRSDAPFSRYPIWSRRNTIRNGDIKLYDFGGANTLYSVGDVIETTNVAAAGNEPWKIFFRDIDNVQPNRPLSETTHWTYSVTNYECQQSASVVDSNGLLIGSYRTNYLGRRGYEIHKNSTNGIS